ncbi:unnamed protein product [Amaranthus hypochondriacus]
MGILGGEHHTGLRILILQISEDNQYLSNKVVVKSGLKSLTRTPITLISSINIANHSNVINEEVNCFLRSCHLCHKPLSHHKDVYMYRGDQGFCSIECRSRQIMMDETKELEAKMKKKRNEAKSIKSIDCSGCETCKLLHDLRRRRNNKFKPLISSIKHQQPLLSIS